MIQCITFIRIYETKQHYYGVSNENWSYFYTFSKVRFVCTHLNRNHVSTIFNLTKGNMWLTYRSHRAKSPIHKQNTIPDFQTKNLEPKEKNNFKCNQTILKLYCLVQILLDAQINIISNEVMPAERLKFVSICKSI